MVLLIIKIGPLNASLAVGTSAAVNILSDETYLALKRVSRGTHWSLHPNDLAIVGVTFNSLKILTIVHLPISLSKNTPVIHLDFYVASSFALQADGLLKLPSFRSIRMGINPETNTAKFLGKSFKAMDVPMRLAFPWKTHKHKRVEESQALAASAPNNKDTHMGWKTVNAVVIGDQEIPQKTAMHIPVSSSCQREL